MRTKKFEVADILTITTGVLLARSEMKAVYEILDFLFGKCFETSELPQAANKAIPYLRKEFPDVEAFAKENKLGKGPLSLKEATAIRRKAIAELGKTRTVTAIC